LPAVSLRLVFNAPSLASAGNWVFNKKNKGNKRQSGGGVLTTAAAAV